MKELKPCPFCGSSPDYAYHTDHPTELSIWCSDCEHADVEHMPEEEAIEAWNRRFNEQILSNEQIESIGRALPMAITAYGAPFFDQFKKEKK